MSAGTEARTSRSAGDSGSYSAPVSVGLAGDNKCPRQAKRRCMQASIATRLIMHAPHTHALPQLSFVSLSFNSDRFGLGSSAARRTRFMATHPDFTLEKPREQGREGGSGL
jgi:hypothetical protein